MGVINLVANSFALLFMYIPIINYMSINYIKKSNTFVMFLYEIIILINILFFIDRLDASEN